jgi:hypothetical protein
MKGCTDAQGSEHTRGSDHQDVREIRPILSYFLSEDTEPDISTIFVTSRGRIERLREEFHGPCSTVEHSGNYAVVPKSSYCPCH